MSGRGDFRGRRGRGGGNRGDGGTRGRGGRGGFSSKLFNPAAGVSAPSEEVRKAEDEIVSKQMELSLSGLGLGEQMPKRPAYGTDGTPVILRSNHFHIVVPDPNFQLYQYSVNVQPEPKLARKRRRAFELLVEMAPFLAEVRPAVVTNNRSMLISVKKLPLENDRGRFQIRYFEAEAQGPGDRDTNLTFTISLTRALPIQQLLQSLTPSGLAQDIDKDSFVQALNIAMSRKPANTAGIVALPNTNKFFPVGTGFLGDLGGGLVALRGYFTSVRTSTLRLLLNINSITASFYQAGPLLNLMRAFRMSHKGGGFEYALGRFLKGIRIEVSHLKNKDGSLRVRTIYGVATSPKIGATTQQVKFHWDEADSDVTVEDYFKRKWNIRLDTPGAPAINVGNVQHPNFMPPELCKVVPGQIARKKLSSDQTTEMIRVACRPPASNAGLITGEGAQVLGLGPGFSDGPTLFGMRIKAEMLTVPGRILPTPNLLYGRDGKSRVIPEGGAWNMRSQKFSVPSRISNWSFLKIQEGDRDPFRVPLPGLITEFQAMMKTCGLTVDPPNPAQGFPVLRLNPSGPERHLDEIDKWLTNVRKTSTRMLLVLIPYKSQVLYAHIKYLADVKHGIHTVCSVASKFETEKGRPQYMANVALKWNLKKGGANQQIPVDKMGILMSKTMAVGIDVTHPSPGSKEGAPSIAGVVASIDDKFGQWPASVGTQESRKEMVTGLEGMILERLKLWRKKNAGALPQNIIVYRDGVSEGQYQTVLSEEAPAFDKAIDQIYPANGPRPKVSIIVVGKRHHTRFYPTKDEETDRIGNPKNGTVVDRGVTSERHWDFFLQAHSGLQGTCKPAHYVVLQDRIGLGANGLEQLTHNMCYLFGRATRSVSICPPAYYADLLCERTRCYLYDTFNQGDAVSTNASENQYDAQRARWTRGVHPDLQDTMFYI